HTFRSVGGGEITVPPPSAGSVVTSVGASETSHWYSGSGAPPSSGAQPHFRQTLGSARAGAARQIAATAHSTVSQRMGTSGGTPARTGRVHTGCQRALQRGGRHAARPAATARLPQGAGILRRLTSRW